MNSSSARGKITMSALAKIAGVGVETIRFYHRQGLLQEPKKAGGRKRLYGEEDIVQLWLIKKAKSLCFSLNEIGKLTGCLRERDCMALQGLVEQKLHFITEKMQALEKARFDLQALTAKCKPDCEERADCPFQRVFHTNGFAEDDSSALSGASDD